jgi:hypothetical protein
MRHYVQETRIFYCNEVTPEAIIFHCDSLNSPVDSLYLNYRVHINIFSNHIKFNHYNDKPKTQNGHGGWRQ